MQLQNIGCSGRSLLIVLIVILGFAVFSPVPAQAEEPCCNITKINALTGVVTAKVNATGQVFEFTLTNKAQLRQMRVGQGVYANLPAKTVSLDGKSVAGTIVAVSQVTPPNDARGSVSQVTPPDDARGSVSQITPPDDARGSVSQVTPPNDARSGVTKVNTARSQPPPCCAITAINASTGVVMAKVSATGQTFQFNLSNPAQLPALQIGQGVYANFKTNQVSLDGHHSSGTITSTGTGSPLGTDKRQTESGGSGSSGRTPPPETSKLSAAFNQSIASAQAPPTTYNTSGNASAATSSSGPPVNGAAQATTMPGAKSPSTSSTVSPQSSLSLSPAAAALPVNGNGQGSTAAPDFSISFAPNSPTTAPTGSSVTCTVNVTALGGFYGTVSLTASINSSSVAVQPSSVVFGCASTSPLPSPLIRNCPSTATATVTVSVPGLQGGDGPGMQPMLPGPPFTLSISGTSQAHTHTAQTSVQPIVEGVFLYTGQTVVDFGEQAVGSSSASKSVTIQNIGTVAETNLNLGIGMGSPGSGYGAFNELNYALGDFAITSNTCGGTIPAGGQCTFAVTFTPSASGLRQAVVPINFNNPGNPVSPIQIVVTGNGS